MYESRAALGDPLSSLVGNFEFSLQMEFARSFAAARLPSEAVGGCGDLYDKGIRAFGGGGCWCHIFFMMEGAGRISADCDGRCLRACLRTWEIYRVSSRDECSAATGRTGPWDQGLRSNDVTADTFTM